MHRSTIWFCLENCIFLNWIKVLEEAYYFHVWISSQLLKRPWFVWGNHLSLVWNSFSYRSWVLWIRNALPWFSGIFWNIRRWPNHLSRVCPTHIKTLFLQNHHLDFNIFFSFSNVENIFKSEKKIMKAIMSIRAIRAATWNCVRNLIF